MAWLATDGAANAGLGFAYAVPVGLAAWWGGARWAIVAVPGACALYLAGTLGHPVSDPVPAFAMRATAFAAVGVLGTALRSRVTRLEHSAEELEAIRAALTPPVLTDVAGLDFAVAFTPSELGLSGDFYLLANGPDDSVVIVLGDVVGHGPKAAQLATFVRARLSACAANTSDPAELLSLANAAILESGRRGALLSAVCLRYLPSDSRLAWAVAGHPPPLRLPDLDPLEPAGRTMLLGVDSELGLSTAEVSLTATEGVLAYTDGATDVRDERGERLDDAGLASIVESHKSLPARELVAAVEKAIVVGWAGEPLQDDLCLIALRPVPQAGTV